MLICSFIFLSFAFAFLCFYLSILFLFSPPSMCAWVFYCGWVGGCMHTFFFYCRFFLLVLFFSGFIFFFVRFVRVGCGPRAHHCFPPEKFRRRIRELPAGRGWTPFRQMVDA